MQIFFFGCLCKKLYPKNIFLFHLLLDNNHNRKVELSILPFHFAPVFNNISQFFLNKLKYNKKLKVRIF